MQQDTRYIRGILMRVASGLFSWSMAAGLLAFSSRQFALTIKHGPSLCPLHTICRPRSKTPCSTCQVPPIWGEPPVRPDVDGIFLSWLGSVEDTGVLGSGAGDPRERQRAMADCGERALSPGILSWAVVNQYLCTGQHTYRSEYPTQLAKMSFDEILDLTADVSNFYNVWS